MIRFDFNGVVGYGVSPHIEEPLLSQILFNMPTKSRFGMVDLALTRNVEYMVSEARRCGHELDLVKTEHLPYYWNERHFASRLREQLNSRAQIVSRNTAPSSTSMVEVGEFVERGLDVVWFHAGCMDGLLSYLRGVGLTYSGAVWDANLLDSGHRGMHLTRPTRLLVDAVTSTVLPYRIWPHEHEEAWSEIAANMVKVIRHGGNVSAVESFARDVRRARSKASRQAERIADASVRLPGRIGMADARAAIESGRVIHRNVLKQRMQRRFGQVLLSAVEPHSRGDMVYVQCPRGRDDLDLRRYLPQGIRGHIPNRVSVPGARFAEFQGRVIASGDLADNYEVI